MAVRIVRRVISAVVALVLLALSIVTLVEVTLAALGRPPWLVDGGAARDELASRPWDDTVVILTSAGLMVLGVALLAVALAPGRKRSVALDSGTEGASLSVRRRSLERYLSGVAAALPGVQSARTSVRRGGLKVRADTTPMDAQQVRERVQQAISDRVRTLRLQPAPPVSVSVRSREG